jgi:hypothetical protein
MLCFHVQIRGASQSAPLSVSFDASLAALARLPALYIEPDGSFVWSGSTSSGQRWQVDGNLVDRGEVLDCVELKGRCLEEKFDELLGALGWPENPLEFQLPQRGVSLGEEEFRRLAATAGGVH